MSDYRVMQNGERSSIVIERLTLKGKAIMELCLERGKNLCMKGFIDCQIERGGHYLQVVEAMTDYFNNELARTSDRRRRALLLDLLGYCAEQLEMVREAEESSVG